MPEEKRKFSQETERIVDGLRLLDDDFMTMVFDHNIEAVQLVLDIILDRDDLTVTDVQVQKIEKSPLTGGRDITLDVYAEDPDRNVFNIEIQRANSGADVHRARFHSAVIDSRLLKHAESFTSMTDSYVIFITENDVMKAGLPIYHVNRRIEEIDRSFRDGNHILYVNGAYSNDEDAIGRLMHDMRSTGADGMYYETLSKQMRHFKEEEGGRAKMCQAIEEYGNRRAAESLKQGIAQGLAQGVAQGVAQGLAQGLAQGANNMLVQLVKDGLLSIKDASLRAKMPETEFAKLVEGANATVS